jgi:hypothetical protein
MSRPFPFLPWAYPKLAHQIEVDQSVGGTLHIEPNDTPRAGKPSRVWIALTHPGGALIPLSDCECQLRVQAQDQGQVVPTSPLQAIAAEGYENVPASEVTFPQVGTYTLILTGKPRTLGEFDPFTLKFEVLVATGSASASPIATPSLTSPSPVATPLPTSTARPASPVQAIAIGGAIAIALGVILWYRLTQPRQNN